MPIMRNFRCDSCENQFEELVESSVRTYGCSSCGGTAESFIGRSRVTIPGTGKQFHPHYDHQLGVYFGSKDEKIRHLASKNMKNVEGEFSPKTHTATRTLCTKEQAKSIDPSVK